MKDNSVSIAKAFAILLMVLGHTFFWDFGESWINMFHMPLFFFFAGYCFKEKYLHDTVEFIKRRFVGLYIPYVKWSLIFLSLHNVLFYLNIYNSFFGYRGKVSELYGFDEFVRNGLFIVFTMTREEQLLGGYWFMKALLFGSIIACFVLRFIKNKQYAILFLLLLTIVTKAYNLFIPYIGIESMHFFAALFFVFGHYYKIKQYNIHINIWIVPFAVLIITIGTVCCECSMLNYSYYQIIPYVFSALAGILMIFNLSLLIQRTNNRIADFMIFVGNNTLTILTWHFLCFKIVTIIIILLFNLPLAMLAEFPTLTDYSQKGWFVIYFLVGVLLPLSFAKRKNAVNYIKYE